MKFPFKEHTNTVVITCCHTVEERMPVLYASHDEEDGMWQFMCGRSHDISEARVVLLSEIHAMDHSVGSLADMPRGYFAEREDPKSDWIVKKR